MFSLLYDQINTQHNINILIKIINHNKMPKFEFQVFDQAWTKV